MHVVLEEIKSLKAPSENADNVFQQSMSHLGFENKYDLSEDLEKASFALNNKIHDAVKELWHDGKYCEAANCATQMAHGNNRELILSIIVMYMLSDGKYVSGCSATKQMAPNTLAALREFIVKRVLEADNGHIARKAVSAKIKDLMEVLEKRCERLREAIKDRQGIFPKEQPMDRINSELAANLFRMTLDPKDTLEVLSSDSSKETV